MKRYSAFAAVSLILLSGCGSPASSATSDATTKTASPEEVPVDKETANACAELFEDDDSLYAEGEEWLFLVQQTNTTGVVGYMAKDASAIDYALSGYAEAVDSRLDALIQEYRVPFYNYSKAWAEETGWTLEISRAERAADQLRQFCMIHANG